MKAVTQQPQTMESYADDLEIAALCVALTEVFEGEWIPNSKPEGVTHLSIFSPYMQKNHGVKLDRVALKHLERAN